MDTEALKETIKRELPHWLRADPEFRDYILDLTRREYADRRETQDRFYELLGELRQLRQEQAQKWEEQNHKWEANQAELRQLRQEQAQKWEANQAELRQLRQEQAQKWEANQAELRRFHEAIMEQNAKYDRGIGALGSRWGMQSEKAFRDALAGILERNFDVQVLNVTEYDHDGTVFGRPEQIELDVIITNGSLVICELKSSIDKAGIYMFERKARFYEQQHGRQADRLIVISPMIERRAKRAAEQLGIDTYGDSTLVEEL